jgi:hypothetical protein
MMFLTLFYLLFSQARYISASFFVQLQNKISVTILFAINGKNLIQSEVSLAVLKKLTPPYLYQPCKRINHSFLIPVSV